MDTVGLRIVQSESSVDVLCGGKVIGSADSSLDSQTEFSVEVPEIGSLEVIVYGGISPVVVVGVNPTEVDSFPIECVHGNGTFRLMVACATDSGYEPVVEVDVVRDQVVQFQRIV